VSSGEENELFERMVDRVLSYRPKTARRPKKKRKAKKKGATKKP